MTDRISHSDAPFEGMQDAGILAVCGISHHTATLSERESFQVGRQDMVQALRELKTVRGVREAAIISTCNRFEAYLVFHEGEEAFPIIRDFFIRWRGIDPKPLRKLFYVRHGSTVARHLFRVAGGLDSLVLGEYQIQNQVKDAYSAACSVKGPGKILHRLFHAAFRAGKAVRTQTRIGAGRMSVAGMAVGVIGEQLSPDDAVMMVGVNESIRIVAEGLKGLGFRNFRFVNRTLYKAEKLATRFGGKGYSLEDLPVLISNVACLVSCTGAQDHVVSSELLDEAASQERCPVLLIDMAVPRDIERPQTPSFPGQLIDLEDLRALRKDQMENRKEELPAAERVVEDKVCAFQSWMDGAFHAAVGALVKEYDRIRQAHLGAALSSFKPEDQEALEQFSRDLMQDFLKVQTKAILENTPPDPSVGPKGKTCRARKERKKD